MKKFILFILAPFMGICLLFAGCASQSQNVAKSLDDTITNLIYTVSSLDWADSEILQNISSVENNQNLNTELSKIQNSQNTASEAEIDNLQNQKIQNDANARIMMRRKDLMDMRARYPESNMQPMGQTAVPYQNAALGQTPIAYQNSAINSQNQTTNNSNPPTRPAKLSKMTRSNLYNTKKQNVSQSIAQSNYLTSRIAAINAEAVAYNTSAIEENSSEVYQRISDLINKRATILVYLNPLYNGTAELSKENISAINAYINIIKDNNSYLKSNKGMVSNQLSQANSVKNNNASSPMINAYIIRTNEALQTRLSKLDAALMAIDAISDILSACIDNPIPQNYNLSNMQLPLIDNNKLSTDNKNANNTQDQCENCEKIPNIDNNSQNGIQNNANLSPEKEPIISDKNSDIEKSQETPQAQTKDIETPREQVSPYINSQQDLRNPEPEETTEPDNEITQNEQGQEKKQDDMTTEKQTKLIDEGKITSPKQLKNQSPNQNIENLDKLAEARQTSVVAKDHFETHPMPEPKFFKSGATSLNIL